MLAPMRTSRAMTVEERSFSVPHLVLVRIGRIPAMTARQRPDSCSIPMDWRMRGGAGAFRIRRHDPAALHRRPLRLAVQPGPRRAADIGTARQSVRSAGRAWDRAEDA